MAFQNTPHLLDDNTLKRSKSWSKYWRKKMELPISHILLDLLRCLTLAVPQCSGDFTGKSWFSFSHRFRPQMVVYVCIHISNIKLHWLLRNIFSGRRVHWSGRPTGHHPLGEAWTWRWGDDDAQGDDVHDQEDECADHDGIYFLSAELVSLLINPSPLVLSKGNWFYTLPSWWYCDDDLYDNDDGLYDNERDIFFQASTYNISYSHLFKC